MKLTNCLLFALASGDGPGHLGDITPFLKELGDYCVETFGLPAYRTKPKENKAQWATRWTARKEIPYSQPVLLYRLIWTETISEFGNLLRCAVQNQRILDTYLRTTRKGEHCGTFDS